MTSNEYDYYSFHLEDSLLSEYDTIMKLKIFVDDNAELEQKYVEAIRKHHAKMSDNIKYIDAGFDLFAPKSITFHNHEINAHDYGISCSATIVKRTYDSRGRPDDTERNTGFYMYPRSSISKSCIRLANNVGIIDAGYRGHLIGMFDAFDTTTIKQFERHLQICAPGLIPILVMLVETKEELGLNTTRGDGGIGSTGK
jgi:dUTP pyrophosphatase